MIPAHWKLREWLTISEAARYLSSVIGERPQSAQGVGEADVLRLALDGHLKFVRKRFGGRLERHDAERRGLVSRPGVNARRYSPTRGEDLDAGIGDHGGAGLAMARPVPGRGSGGAEEPRAGCPG